MTWGQTKSHWQFGSRRAHDREQIEPCFAAKAVDAFADRSIVTVNMGTDKISRSRESNLVARSAEFISLHNVEVHTSATGGAAPILVEVCRHPPNPTRSG